MYKKQTSSQFENASFGTQKRFPTILRDHFPPPGNTQNLNKSIIYQMYFSGTYFRDIFMKDAKTHKHFTKLPEFEWDGFADRLKGTSPEWRQAPNRYNPKDVGSISALLEKTVSKRGPYDCFTGPRDGTTIKNHFAPPSFKGPLDWFKTWPNELDHLLNHKDKSR